MANKKYIPYTKLKELKIGSLIQFGDLKTVEFWQCPIDSQALYEVVDFYTYPKRIVLQPVPYNPDYYMLKTVRLSALSKHKIRVFNVGVEVDN